MRRIYKKPETILVTCYGDIVLDSTSIIKPEEGRGVDGGPTVTGDGVDLPGSVGETNENTDPYGGHGSGTGQGGNRSKSGMIWDEW